MRLAVPPWVKAMLTRPPRKPRRPRPPSDLPRVLAWARVGALALAAVLVAASTSVALAESYRALYLWASTHAVAGRYAIAWPLMVDTFIVIGEIGLFVATLGDWDWRARGYWWAVTAGGLAVSIAGNVGHVHTSLITDRLTAAVPPLAAFISLTVGIGILKRVLLLDHKGRHAGSLAALLDGLDTRGIVAALDELGIADTGVLAALAGVSDRTVRRHRAAAAAAAAEQAAAAAAMSGHPAANGADTVQTVSAPRWGERRAHWRRPETAEAPSGG